MGRNRELRLQEHFINRHKFVHDEATGALDKKTESNVIDSLEDLPTSLTIILYRIKMSLKLCNKIWLGQKVPKIL